MKKAFVVLALFVSVLFSAWPAFAACTAGVTNNAKALFLAGAFNSATDYRIALYTQAAASLDADTAIYTTSGELATANGYTQGAKTLSSWVVSTTTQANANDVAWIDFADPAWTSSTITADCYMIFAHETLSSSCTEAGVPYGCCSGTGAGTNCDNPAILIGTFTSTSSTNGTFTVVMPAAAYNTAILRLQ
jgi:hypothetical protein